MSIEKGREYFRQFGMEDRVQEFEISSATVEPAAQALGVEGEKKEKTLSNLYTFSNMKTRNPKLHKLDPTKFLKIYIFINF